MRVYKDRGHRWNTIICERAGDFFMRTRKITQMRLVEASTPTELMYKFNEMMDEISTMSANVKEPVISLETLTAYVVYTEQEVIAENRDDYHSLKGEIFHCSDCKYFHENDLHNGSADCPFRHGHTASYDNVCTEFWDAYEAKEDILYVPRNKDGSVNRLTNKGKRYLKLKETGAVK